MKKILNTVLLVLCFVGSAGVGQAMAQTETFMLVPGIKGSSTGDHHKDWIDVVSVSQTLEPGERPRQCTLAVGKDLDSSGPLLWAAAVTGRVFGKIQIEVISTLGEKRQVLYQIKLLTASVTSITTSGGEFGYREHHVERRVG